MKLLIVDSNTESQAFCARRVEAFNQSDMEMLDLKVKLVSEKEFIDRVHECDVLVVGSGVGERGVVIARQAIALVPWLHIIMFVSEEAYGGGAFRSAHAVGVRKVFPDNASPLDFLQELVAIHAEFRREGRAREGKVVVVTHAKGGVGATSLTAALGEVCSSFNRSTLLWDLDVETRDLSRALTVNGAEAQIVSAWINGTREISRDSLRDALIPLGAETSVLMPPDKMAESMDLICHTDGIEIVQRVLEISRVLFDAILIDTSGRLGPSTGALLRHADYVVIVIDDSVLGLTAVDLYLNFIKTLVGGVDRIIFAVNSYSGTTFGIPQIAAELEPGHHLGEGAWRLPPIPFDSKGAKWPGSGKTLYSMGNKGTRVAFEKIARELKLIDTQTKFSASYRGNEIGGSAQLNDASSSSWLSKVFGKKSSQISQ